MPSAPLRPLLLRHDNFTSTARTPWGGDRIVSRFKSHLIGRDLKVGESWEVSVEPDFPSKTVDGLPLDGIVRADPVGWLGYAYGRAPSAELLVKLLDAAEDLSVQIHPSDDYERLSASEGGKPEAWYVVDAEPGAVIYLGLAPGVDEARLRQALTGGEDVSVLLDRIPVAIGDYFVIHPGTPHAIGRGCLLVEPQRVTPGCRGITYRFWDWNRRYDSAGREAANGTPRSLHVEDALAVTRFDGPRGEDHRRLVASSHGVADPGRSATRTVLSGPFEGLASNDLLVERLEGTGALSLESGRFRGLTVLGGSVRFEGDPPLEVGRGQSVAIPAGATFEVHLEHAHAILAAVP